MQLKVRRDMAASLLETQDFENVLILITTKDMPTICWIPSKRMKIEAIGENACRSCSLVPCVFMKIRMA